MKKVYSQVDPNRLLHVVFDANAPFENRADLSEPEQWLQVSVVNLPPAKKVNPHIHNPRPEKTPAIPSITQECWIVLRGEIEVGLFDLDRRVLGQQTLLPGHVLVTFCGGHSLQCGSGGGRIIECKNGPYLGRDYTTF